MRKQHEGVSLLEVILVLAVGGSILYFSIQQYLSYRYDADVAQIQANVNAIFQAMTGFYRANCYGTTNAPGVLNPNNSNPPNSNFHIDITNDLIGNGYLTTTLIPDPLVNATGSGTQGYIAQFNQSTAPRQICTALNTTTIPSTCTASVSIGNIVVWNAQVAVQLKDTAHTNTYLNLLTGDCLSSASGNIVTPCSASSTKGNYVVWQRFPSNANPQAQSDYWATIPTVSQFTQMYTTSSIQNLTNGTTTNQYFLCGN